MPRREFLANLNLMTKLQKLTFYVKLVIAGVDLETLSNTRISGPPQTPATPPPCLRSDQVPLPAPLQGVGRQD